MNRRVFISGALGAAAVAGMGAFSLWRPEAPLKDGPAPIKVSSAPLPPKVYERDDKAVPLPEPVQGQRAGSWIGFDGAEQVPLVSTGAFGGALEVPEPEKAGLYSAGAQLGAQRGAAIIAAHVDKVDLSPAAFSKLHELVPGSIIIASWAGKVVKYKAVSVRLYEQDALPATLFDLAGPHTLHLVTCAGESVASDGPWRYRYNLIVSAIPL